MSNKKESKNIMISIITIIIVIIPALFFGYIGKPTEMGLMIVAGAITVAFLNIDKIKSFKGAGFEAEMKEFVEEAYATMDNIKEMLIPIMLSSLNEIVYSSRWGGIDQEKKHNMKNDIEKVISKFDIKDEKISATLEDFYRYSTWDLFYYFKQECLKNRDKNSEQLKKLNAIYSEENMQTTNYPQKQYILEVLNIDEESLNPTEKKKLEDYVYYKKNRKLP